MSHIAIAFHQESNSSERKSATSFLAILNS